MYSILLKKRVKRRKKPKPKRYIQVRVTPEMFNHLTMIAKDLGVALSDMTRGMLQPPVKRLLAEYELSMDSWKLETDE